MAMQRSDGADYSEIVPNERRRKLLYAAMQVIAKHDLQTITMDQIAHEAGVTRVTLYREFGSRGTLIEAVAAFRLMLFDEVFFASTDLEASFASVVERYLIESIRVLRSNPISRRWAGGGMKFLHPGSLIHRVATATWSPVHARYSTNIRTCDGDPVEQLAHWLIVLQYSLGRMVVETECDDQSVMAMVRQFVLPAFAKV